MQHRRRFLRLAALLPVLCFASCGGEEESGVERWIMDLDATVERAREQLMAIPGVNPQEVDTQVGAFRLELLQAPDYRLRLAQDQSFVLSVTGPGFEGRTLSVPGSWVQRPRGVELTPDEGEPEQIELINGGTYTIYRHSGLGTYEGEALVLAWQGGTMRVVMVREPS